MSQLGQDKIVDEYLHGKRNGVFVDIGACFNQERYDVEIRRVGRKVQGIGVVAVVADANVRSAIEQKPHAVRAIAPRRHVQRRPAP